MDFFKLRESAGEFGTDKLKKKYEDDTPGQNEKYRPPTKAEIDADRKKDQKGKPRPSISAKSVNRKVYGKMMGGLKKESVEQLDELDAKTQKKFVAGAKAMKAYAQKNGGIDKADFMKAAKMMDDIARINLLQAGPILSRLNRFVDGLDTDVRERIYVELKKVGLVESMNEELSVSDGVAKWITDFQASDAPQFQGKSDDEKKKMAIAAFMAAKQKDGGDDKKPQKDENTRASLMKKLAKSAASSKKGKEKVTLKKAPWDKKNESVQKGTHISDDPKAMARIEKFFKGLKHQPKGKDMKDMFGFMMKQMGYNSKTGLKEDMNESLDEAKFSPKDIKMAIGIASDKRYAGGNMSGAVKAMDKMKPGISDHPQVRAVLKRQNEDLAEAAPKIKGPSVKGGKIMGVPGKKLGQKLDIEPQVSGMKLMFRVTSDDGSFNTVDVAGLAKMVR